MVSQHDIGEHRPLELASSVHDSCLHDSSFHDCDASANCLLRSRIVPTGNSKIGITARFGRDTVAARVATLA